jgi:hypothetical protein
LNDDADGRQGDDPGSALAGAGFAFVQAAVMDVLLQRRGMSDWAGFAASWDDLGMDVYMADGGRYRRRRHGAFAVDAQRIVRKPHQPHYQSRDYNPLNGGIERWFEPIRADIAEHPAMCAALRLGWEIFDPLTAPERRPPAWHVEVHQFRIEADAAHSGLPTPEGAHRDGVDWVLILLVARVNALHGTTHILDNTRRAIGSFTLERPLDAALVDDARVYHGVTPLVPADPAQRAHRDVLVVTYRR